jgi:hypothetical protein
MRKLHGVRLISVALAVVGLAAAASGASASGLTGLPLVPTTDGTSALARTLSSITFGCCDPPTFAGARAKSPIRWRSWTQRSAVGTGAMWVDPCHPDCAAEGYYPYPATVRLSDPQRLGGHLVFSEISITYTTHKRVSWLTRATVHYKFLTGSPPKPHGPDYFFTFP